MRHQLTAAKSSSIHAGGTGLKTKATAWLFAASVTVLGFGSQAHAAIVGFSLTGQGYSLTGIFTTTTDVSPADPDPNCGTAGANPCRSDPAGAARITAISGSFSDSADGIVNAAVGALIPIAPSNERDPVFDPLPPTSLSFVDYAPPSGFFSYDNLYFAAGSPIDCGTFPFPGTFLDDFGAAFTVAGGYTVNIWGDGDLHGPGTTSYGIDVVRDGALLSSSFDGLSGSAAVPEPSTWALMLVAFGGLGWRLRRRGAVGAIA
jgi:PEP-CTERM motif